MSTTVNQLIATFQRRYPECDATTALNLVLDAHRQILSRIQIRNDTQYVTPLVAGTREYSLSGQVFKIHSAYYEQSSTSWIPMIERSTDELDVQRWGWRLPSYTGTPYEYYISSADVGDSAAPTIGFVPIPDTSTSGTYPRVTIYCTTYTDLTGTDTIPSNVLDNKVYLYRMYADWAQTVMSSEAEYWNMEAEKQMQINLVHVQSVQSKGTDMIFPTAAYMPTRIV